MKSLNLNKVLPCLKSRLLVTLLFFVFGAQKAIAQDTTFASVTITTVDSTLAADTLRWDVKFKVDTTGTNGNADGGWIIQKITMSRVVYPCPRKEGQKPLPGPAPITYYEVWPVAPGSDTTTSELPNGADDSFMCSLSAANAPDNTYGTFKVIAELAFVNDPGTAPDGSLPNTPGDPGGADTNRTDAGGSTWAPGSVPQAGGLVATTTEPSFWGKLKDSGKVTTRTWEVSWDKCKDSSDVEDPVKEEEIPVDDDGDGKSKRPIGNSSQMNSQNLTFYPNPAKTELTTMGADIIKTSIYSVSGEILLESDKKQINIEDLAPGVYVIHLSTGTEITREFLIIE